MAALKPPFTLTTAIQKLKFAQSAWNTRDPLLVSKAYTPDCIWRNRTNFIRGTDEIISFLTAKWEREVNYRLRKELFCFSGNKIAVQFWYEYQDKQDGMKWKRCYGLEDWTFDDSEGATGKMRKRMMCGNDLVLGRDGDGVGNVEEGVEGRWFVDGVDVDDESVTKLLTERHF